MHKLEEALLLAGFDCSRDLRGAAVDLGAAPGAWTEHLSKQLGPDSTARIYAVDPAELDPSVLSRPNVRHLQMKGEAAVQVILEEARALRASSGDTASASRDHPVDLIVCDINDHCETTSKIIAPLVPLLRPGGLMVMTMKCRGRGIKREKEYELVQETLGLKIGRLRSVWTMANTNYERTFLGWKLA